MKKKLEERKSRVEIKNEIEENNKYTQKKRRRRITTETLKKRKFGKNMET